MPDKFGGFPSTLVPHGWTRPLSVGAPQPAHRLRPGPRGACP
jgi:hypothetical protein